jgi:hypothetical protein
VKHVWIVLFSGAGSLARYLLSDRADHDAAHRALAAASQLAVVLVVGFLGG